MVPTAPPLYNKHNRAEAIQVKINVVLRECSVYCTPGLLLSETCIGMLRWIWSDLFSSKEKMNGDDAMLETPSRIGII